MTPAFGFIGLTVADPSHTLPITHADLTNQLLRDHLGLT